jgi:outer membrane receptor protein involved in Fe transport
MARTMPCRQHGLPILATDYSTEGWQTSQELQVQYTTPRLTTVGGLYYFEKHSEDFLVVTFTPPGTVPNGTSNCDCNFVKSESWAAFTNWVFNVTDEFSVAAGTRYTSDKKGSIPDEFDIRDPSTKWLPVQLYEKTSKTTFSGSLSYRFSDTIMAYTSYAQGLPAKRPSMARSWSSPGCRRTDGSSRRALFYQARTFFDEGNTVQIAQLDPITLYGASAAFESADGSWKVMLGGRNLSDEKYSQGGNPPYTTSSGYAEAAYTRGREHYISLGYSF